MINGPRGTIDILPPVSSKKWWDDSLKWRYIEKKATDIFDRYNYQEIRTPIFEYTELFQRGIGEETDIVEKEMYTFEDKGGRSITLRPEGTAPVVRSYLENKLYGQAQPKKFFYKGPMFRYERPQAGRYRQFHQIGVEVLGGNDPMLDAEVISLGINFMEELGLKELQVIINSIGCPQCRPEYIEKLKDFVFERKEDFCDDCFQRASNNPLRILDCKNKKCKDLIKDAPEITDFLCDDCKEHFSSLQEYLDSLDITYQVDSRLVRGLDYYTNTAFEVKYKGLGAQDTIFGGGRYNGLTEEIGDRSIPGIGFAIGVERLLLTLEKQGIELPVDSSLDLYIVTIGKNAKNEAFKLINKLRKNNIKTDMDYLDKSVRSQMKAADRMNATYTIIIGEDELKKDVVTIRNMKSGKEQEIKLSNIVNSLQDMI